MNSSRTQNIKLADKNLVCPVMSTLASSPIKVTAHVNHVVKNYSSESPSFLEKMATLEQWFTEHTGQPYSKVSLLNFAQLLVKKGLALDND